MSDTLNARRVAFAALNDVFYKRGSLDDALDPRGEIGEAFTRLDPRDRAFVRLLISVVLKHARLFDAHIATLLAQPIAALKPASLLTVFRLGMAQLCVLKTPPHAVVDTSVELAAAEGMTHLKPLVNAVLRRLVREGFTMPAREDVGRLLVPEWMWQSWVDDYGEATARDISVALLDEAPIDLTLRDQSAQSLEEWAQRLDATVLPTGSLRLNDTAFVPGLPGFEDGAWWVQNAAAAIPAGLIDARPGMTVVDLCAAPGGKTAQLAARGARVIALDRSSARMQRLRENMTRLNLSVEAIVADGAVWQPEEKVDAVLLDAPCSATGTMRHQPDALWLKQPQDQTKLAALQARLLDHAWTMLKPGGVLVYCTCSLQHAEGEAQIYAFLSRTPDAARSNIAVLGLDLARTPSGDLRILPQHWQDYGGMDGFFVSKLVRKNEVGGG